MQCNKGGMKMNEMMAIIGWIGIGWILFGWNT